MASSIAQGHVPMTATKSHNMAVIPQMVDQDMQPWFIVYLFDIGHPCYGQLTHVKTKYTACLNLYTTEIRKDSFLTLNLFGINR